MSLDNVLKALSYGHQTGGLLGVLDYATNSKTRDRVAQMEQAGTYGRPNIASFLSDSIQGKPLQGFGFGQQQGMQPPMMGAPGAMPGAAMNEPNNGLTRAMRGYQSGGLLGLMDQSFNGGVGRANGGTALGDVGRAYQRNGLLGVMGYAFGGR